MAELISLWNNSSIGCGVVVILLVGVVMCWDFVVLVSLCLCCDL